MRVPRSIAALGIVLSSVGMAAAEEVRFGRDVMAVISKAGCNSGGCHGNANGKGGFKLSLWGDSPAADYKALTKSAKRVNKERPLDSLILRKPTEQTAHEGGKRFELDSSEYEVLSKWLVAGAPVDPDDAVSLVSVTVSPADSVLESPVREVKLTVEATFSDGSKRDVSRWAVYEPSNPMVEVGIDGGVRFSRPGQTGVLVRYLHLRESARVAFVEARGDYVWSAPAEANVVDRHVFARLRQLKLNPSAVCDDATFVRRAHLDLIGLLPTAEEARGFVADSAADKRARLVDALLKRPEFDEFQALRWSDLLRNEEKTIDNKGVEIFHAWIRDSFRARKGLDLFVAELLTARGSTYKNGAANYYRALRNPTLRSEATAQLFLGARLQCAKCHNHPFERWTQDDYYQFAALFDGIDYKIVENKRRDKYDKHQFVGEQIVERVSKREFNDPRSKKPPVPTLLGAAVKDDKARFDELADWVTRHPAFSRVQVNRIWFQMMGRGIFTPIDDYRETNPSVNPELLEAMAHAFEKGKYEVRHVMRLIANSRTYQLDSVPNATNGADQENFSRAIVRRLTAEQLVDAAHAALDVPAQFAGYERGRRAMQVSGVRRKDPHHADRFMKLFGKPERLMSSDMERSNGTTLGQVFELISGETLDALIGDKENRIGTLLKAGNPDAAIIETLYWSALTRAPTAAESAALVEYASNAQDRRRALEDVAWGILNAKEFLLRK